MCVFHICWFIDVYCFMAVKTHWNGLNVREKMRNVCREYHRDVFWDHYSFWFIQMIYLTFALTKLRYSQKIRSLKSDELPCHESSDLLQETNIWFTYIKKFKTDRWENKKFTLLWISQIIMKWGSTAYLFTKCLLSRNHSYMRTYLTAFWRNSVNIQRIFVA